MTKTVKPFTATIETLEHTDVRGNILRYLKITNNGAELLINVGEKTVTKVNELLKTPKQTELNV